MSMSLYLCVFLLFFIDLILGVNPILTGTEACYILFLLIPVSALTCLSRPTKMSHMKRHVLSAKYKPYLDYALYVLKVSFIKIILATAIIYGIRIYYYHASILYF
jgi:hypothetical protein